MHSRIILLAAACLQIVSAVAVPALHRHIATSSDVAYSADELPERGPVHQDCEACTAHGTAAIPSTAAAAAAVPSTHAAAPVFTHALTSTRLLAHARARAPPVL